MYINIDVFVYINTSHINICYIYIYKYTHTLLALGIYFSHSVIKLQGIILAREVWETSVMKSQVIKVF